MEILSYFLSLITCITLIFAPFCKNMKNVLIICAIGNLTAGISYLLVKSISGGVLSIIAIAILTINYVFTSRGKKIPKALFIAYMAILSAVNLALFKHWYDIFTVLAAIAFVLCMCQENENIKRYRLFLFLNALVWLFYDFISVSYGNLVVHGIQFVSTVLSMIPKKQKKEAIL